MLNHIDLHGKAALNLNPLVNRFFFSFLNAVINTKLNVTVNVDLVTLSIRNHNFNIHGGSLR